MIHGAIYTAIGLFLLTIGGNWACQLLLNLTGLKDATAGDGTPPDLRVGRVIGSMERLVIAAGVALQSWEIIAAVVALKSIARFKELHARLSAEYFLVGSLFSILWAFAVTGGWMLYDVHLGANLVSPLLHAKVAS